MRTKLSLAFILMMMSVLLIVPASAQARSVYWEVWDVVIDNVDTTNNTFDVSEQYTIQFSGTFEFGSRVIPLNNLEALDNIRVSQGGQALQPGRCVSTAAQGRGTYCVEDVQGDVSIKYYFRQPITSSEEQFEISYTVVGALRVYEGGDQLWWIGVTRDKFGFSVGSSTIRVELPQGVFPREGVDQMATYGAAGEVSVNRNVVTATASEVIGPDQSFEIRVQYPHDPNARTAAWQADFDEQRQFDEEVKPLLDLVFVVISLLIAVTGPLFVYSLWRRKGRDPKVGPVPTYLTEPPSDLRPAVVGTLVDEKADTRDVLSTVIDLSQRGYVVIEETRTKGLFGLGGSSEHTFKRTDKPLDNLHSYERKIMNKVFKGKLERSLDSLKNKFHKDLPGLKKGLYDELKARELVTASPESIRAIYSGIGAGVVGLSVLGIVIAINTLEMTTESILCIPLALLMTGLAFVITGQYMPTKTASGALEAAKWNAFREYLKNLEKYTDLENAAGQFDKYLPYAVAFGLDRSWIQRFSKVETIIMPPWYFPTHRGGHFSRGYTAGTPVSTSGPSANDMLPGELARAGGGGLSLDTLSGGISESLESISDGLTNMLNSASRTLESRPSSSSSGGGGWSGGGSSGGGGSGGGSSGFG